MEEIPEFPPITQMEQERPAPTMVKPRCQRVSYPSTSRMGLLGMSQSQENTGFKESRGGVSITTSKIGSYFTLCNHGGLVPPTLVYDNGFSCVLDVYNEKKLGICFLCNCRHEKNRRLIPEKGSWDLLSLLPRNLAAQTGSKADAVTSVAYRGRCGSLSALHTGVTFQAVNPFEIVKP